MTKGELLGKRNIYKTKQRKYNGKARSFKSYYRQIAEITYNEKSYQWVEKAGLKGNTEILIKATTAGISDPLKNLTY